MDKDRIQNVTFLFRYRYIFLYWGNLMSPVILISFKYPTGNLNFAISLIKHNENSQKLNSAYYCFFKNLSMIAYLIEIQKSKFESEFDQSESGR